MSSASRKRSREEYEKWLAWYNTLSEEEQQKEDDRLEALQAKNLLYIFLGLAILIGFVWLTEYIKAL